MEVGVQNEIQKNKMKLKQVGEGYEVCPHCEERQLKQIKGENYECQNCKYKFVDEDVINNVRLKNGIKTGRKRLANINHLTRIIVYLSGLAEEGVEEKMEEVVGACQTSIRKDCFLGDCSKTALSFLLRYKIVLLVRRKGKKQYCINPLFKYIHQDSEKEVVRKNERYNLEVD